MSGRGRGPQWAGRGRGPGRRGVAPVHRLIAARSTRATPCRHNSRPDEQPTLSLLPPISVVRAPDQKSGARPPKMTVVDGVLDGERQANRRTTGHQADGKHQILGPEQHRRTTGERTDDQRQTTDLAVGVRIPRGALISAGQRRYESYLPCSARTACHSFHLVLSAEAVVVRFPCSAP